MTHRRKVAAFGRVSRLPHPGSPPKSPCVASSIRGEDDGIFPAGGDVAAWMSGELYAPGSERSLGDREIFRSPRPEDEAAI